eukprot:scaffold19184_cov46-Cyclotella_meneghiniana.AAC.7
MSHLGLRRAIMCPKMKPMSSYWEPSYQHLQCPGCPVLAVYTPCRTQRSSKYSLIRAVLVISCIAVSTLVVTHLFATRITHLEPGRGWNGTGRSHISAPPRLRPICMGSRKNKGYETRLHSHIGEACALDWACGVNRLYTWGSRFTSISDCYSLKFIMTYEGNNPVVLCIQMHLSLWAMDIVHRTRDFNVDAYMSKLACNTQYDPLLKEYLMKAAALRHKYPPPDGEMKPENMPGYRKPRSGSSESPASQLDSRHGVTIDGETLDSFSIYPVNYHTPTIGPIRNFVTTRSQSKGASNPPHSESTRHPQPLMDNEITDVARQLTRYQAILYAFGGGHIHHTLSNNSIPIQIVASADLDSHARSLMQELMHIPRIFDTARKLFDWISSDSEDDTYTDIYISHAPLRI